MTQQVLYSTATSQVLQWQDASQFNYAAPASGMDTLAVTATEWANQAGAWYVVNGALTQTNPNAPTAAQLLEQTQASQSAALRSSYQQAISSCPVSVSGTAYTLALDAANATLNLSTAMSAQQALSAPAWTADADVTLGHLCTVSGVPLFCSKPGTTGSTAPTAPSAIGTPVADGTAAWELFARSAELINGTFAWFTAAEIVQVGQQIELFLHTQKSTLIGLLAEVNAQTAVPASPVTWPK